MGKSASLQLWGRDWGPGGEGSHVNFRVLDESIDKVFGCQFSNADPVFPGAKITVGAYPTLFYFRTNDRESG
jgi:hypothetical protein